MVLRCPPRRGRRATPLGPGPPDQRPAGPRARGRAVTSVLLVPDEPDQAPRLAAFRAEHPAVTVQPGQFQTWEARIIEPAGETIVVRHTLRELLDRLGALL